MQTMHSVLLVGPYDWQPDLFPAVEYQDRLNRLWSALDGNIGGLVVYGDTRHNAELVYLTGLTPKVRQAMALIQRDHDPRVLVPGTKAGLTSAKRLTWVPELELLGDPAKAVAEWKTGLNGPGIGLLGGQHMRAPLYESMQAAAPLVDVSPAYEQASAVRGPKEWAVLRAGCAMLRAGEQALRQAHARVASATAAVLEAEHAALLLGAQNVQILFSLDGGRTLRPFEQTLDALVDPLQVYMAVRHAGYWAAGFIRASRAADPMAATAQAALRAMLHAARPGASGEQLIAAANNVAGSAATSLKLHPLVAANAGHAIGTALDGPALKPGAADGMRAGGCYFLQTGVAGDGCHALASAMIGVGAGDARGGNDLLWTEQVSP